MRGTHVKLTLPVQGLKALLLSCIVDKRALLNASAILIGTLRAINVVHWLPRRYRCTLREGSTVLVKMLSAAQLLDELMGRDRNLAPDEKRSNVRWDDESVS